MYNKLGLIPSKHLRLSLTKNINQDDKNYGNYAEFEKIIQGTNVKIKEKIKRISRIKTELDVYHIIDLKNQPKLMVGMINRWR